MNDIVDSLRHAPLLCVIQALASGRTQSAALTRAFLEAIEHDAHLRAWVHVDAEGAMAAAHAADARRVQGAARGWLDGVPLAIKDNIDVAGMPTLVGLPSRRQSIANEDAFIVARLRAAGAVFLGKTALDEATLGTVGRNAHHGDVGNPVLPDRVSGGSSAGSAVAVAAGHAVAALGSDTLGSNRLPAGFCGMVGLKPTTGELSCRGLIPSLRRLDCPGLITRSVGDLDAMLQVMAGYDPDDPRSRRRRVALAAPDWNPASLRVGVPEGLATMGAQPEVIAAFEAAVARASDLLQQAEVAYFDWDALEIPVTRRAALLLMEAELLATHGEDLDRATPALMGLLEFARRKSAVDAAVADRRLDAHQRRVRHLFERFDVLLLPLAPVLPPLRDQAEPGNLADFTALASMAGCPALALPLGQGMGLQLVGQPGSDLRLLELGTVLEAVLGPQHEY
ncbi:MAG TPA: amidase [Chiayiivirga sp.]|nr:amidase [Chiayiivirga sp.]